MDLSGTTPSEYAAFVAGVAVTNDDALIDRLAELEDRKRRLEAERAAVLAEVERRKIYRVDGHASMWGLLRASLHWSSGECRDRMRVARFAAEFPDVGEMLFEGLLAVDAAEAIARAGANPYCGHEIGQVLGELLQLGMIGEHDEVARAAQRWERLTDSDGARDDAAARHARRRAGFTISGAMGGLSASWCAADAVANQAVFDKFCDAEFLTDWEETVTRHGGQASKELMPRTDAQRRADALTAIFQAAAATPADAHRPEPVVNLVIDIDTFQEAMVHAGLIDPASLLGDPPAGPMSKRRCETDTGIILDPYTVVQTALAGTIRRVIVNSSGQVVDWGRRRRLFTGSARRAAMLQGNRCIYPGCRVRLGNCQADHLDEWHRNRGPTRPENSGPLCGAHNRHKSRGYRVWRDPSGRWHTYRPDGSEIC